ncbi:unnamed protein product [Orchesella dallaii]|uniref:PDZ and LIM domain protein Zasp n=1 Tax=Orchesella dallaii TaxID=48710 RepID=A0ABP1RXM1_9HEXA
MATPIRLQRQSANQPWGFRIHGGQDFNQPILVVKVTAGSLAAQNGIAPGDQLIQLNGRDALRMRHKEAQDIILGASNTVDLQVLRQGSTWKPQVQVLGEANRAPAGAPVPQVTKTSLAKQPAPAHVQNPLINSQAKPFSIVSQEGQVMVNNQYNTPISIYSEQSIAETLSAQSEVLVGGAIGVNFKKNDRKYNPENSEVYKMLLEVENEENSGAPSPLSPRSTVQPQPVTLPQVQLRPVAPRPAPAPQPVAAPAPQPRPQPVQAPPQQQHVQAPQQQQQQQQAAPAGPPGSNPNVCAECERLIVGVFVRIKDKNLHVECFKCNTCGQSLKNVGYYNINNKLYCDVHAKTVARANPPAAGLEPFTVPGGGASGVSAPTAPAGFGAGPAPTFAPVAPPKPFSYSNIRPQSPSVMAPIPFHHSPSSGITHVTAPRSPKLRQPQQSAPAPLPSYMQQQQIQAPGAGGSSAGGLLQQYSSSSYESSSFSSSSMTKTETISSSSSQQQQSGSGLRVTWPPKEDLAVDAASGAPIVQASAPAPAAAPPQSLLQQVAPPPQFAPAPAPITAPSQFSVFGQSQGQQQQFKPVQAPQGKFKQPQVAYKPLSTLLAPAGKPIAPAPAPLQQQSIPPPYISAPAPAPAPAPISIPPPMAPAPAPAPISIPQPIAPAPAPPAPSAGAGGGGLGGKGGKTLSILPKRGRGVLTQPGPRVAICSACQKQIRGPFVTANSKFYCPDHFKCATPNCGRGLMDVGFVEEKEALHCEFCWESHLAPQCARCQKRIKCECLNAIGRSYHPECFQCRHCNKPFGNSPFFLEDGEPYCDADWNELFTTKCYACGFPIEAGDRWVEAMNQNYHSQCFNCAACKKNLEGQSFFAKAGRPFCKSHAR